MCASMTGLSVAKKYEKAALQKAALKLIFQSLREAETKEDLAIIQKALEPLVKQTAVNVVFDQVDFLDQGDLLAKVDKKTVKRVKKIRKMINEHKTGISIKRQRKILNNVLELCAKNLGVKLPSRGFCGSRFACRVACIGGVILVAAKIAVLSLFTAGVFEFDASIDADNDVTRGTWENRQSLLGKTDLENHMENRTFITPSGEGFAKADTDLDGQITTEEYGDFQKKQKTRLGVWGSVKRSRPINPEENTTATVEFTQQFAAEDNLPQKRFALERLNWNKRLSYKKAQVTEVSSALWG